MTLSIDIVAAAADNADFRRVLATGPHAQLVVMCIPPGGEIGEEIHATVDQVLAITEGRGSAVIEGVSSPIAPGTVVHVPAGALHNIVNVGPGDLRLWTVYAPPEHEPGTVHRTKADADAAEESHAPAPVG